jgi:hypothetical protein
MLGLTVTMNNALFETTQQTNAAATVATVGEIIYTDLNQSDSTGFKQGFSISNPNKIVFVADTSMGLHKLATITYDATQIDAETGLHKLYRIVGSSSVCLGKNLVSINFQYFNSDGATTTTPSSVDAIRVKLVAQVSGVTQGFSTTLNDFKVFPPNLN